MMTSVPRFRTAVRVLRSAVPSTFTTLATLGCSALALDPPSSKTSNIDASASDGGETSRDGNSATSDAGLTTDHTDHGSTSSTDERESSSANDSVTGSAPDPTAAAPTAETAERTSSEPVVSSDSAQSTGAPSTTAPDGGSSTMPDATSEPGCALSSAAPSAGVHVSPTGEDTSACGSGDAPCRTITFAQGRAALAGLEYVYIATGQYNEHLEVTAPIALIGGWTPNVGTWTRPCADLAAQTVVNSTHFIGLRVELEGVARVESLTIKASPASNTPGESRYGIFARGANTRLALEDVTVQAGSARAGAGGPSGTTIAGESAANCSTGDGADGAPAAATPATVAGSFNASGYVPGDGVDGADGNPGQGGMDGLSVVHSCTYCNSECMGVAGGSKTASGGKHGCGGGHGTGGFGGSGGGASIGVFAWAASVELGPQVRVIAGDGGNGAAGGSAGLGAPGTPGSAGQEVECNPGTSCGGSCGEEFDGASGTPGGDGSAGANGGDGAGGWSVALVGTAEAFVGSEHALTLFGQAGVSLGAGPTGFGGQSYALP